MHIILTGATGLCGSAVIKHCINDPAITRLTILSRRPVAQAEGQEKVNVIIHSDFTQYQPSLLDQLKGAEGCIWALGGRPHLAGVSKEEYIKVTVDYAMAAAAAFATLASPFRFVFVSGEAADVTEQSMMFFARIKGRAENHLRELASRTPSLSVFVARPGLIDYDVSPPSSPRSSAYELAMRVFKPIMRTFAKGSIIHADFLAHALLIVATGDGKAFPEGVGVEAQGWTLRNTMLRKLAGL